MYVLILTLKTFIVKGEEGLAGGGAAGSAAERLRKKPSGDLGMTAQSCPRQHTERERRRQWQRWTARLR